MRNSPCPQEVDGLLNKVESVNQQLQYCLSSRKFSVVRLNRAPNLVLEDFRKLVIIACILNQLSIKIYVGKDIARKGNSLCKAIESRGNVACSKNCKMLVLLRARSEAEETGGSQHARLISPKFKIVCSFLCPCKEYLKYIQLFYCYYTVD